MLTVEVVFICGRELCYVDEVAYTDMDWENNILTIVTEGGQENVRIPLAGVLYWREDGKQERPATN